MIQDSLYQRENEDQKYNKFKTKSPTPKINKM